MTISANFPNVKPSLLLDFANAQQLPPSVTFTRATTAAYYNGSTTALADQNLIIYSQEFNSWQQERTTTTANSTTAPDGTSTADTIAASGAAQNHSVYHSNEITLLNGLTYTYSVYAKKNGSDFVQLTWYQHGFSNAYVNFDLNAGTVGTASGCTATITSVGSGWYRCTMTATCNTGSAGRYYVSLVTSSTSAQFEQFAATTQSIYAWGAQAEIRSAATAYTATTTQPITNYVPVLLTAGGGQPRFDHNPTTSESLGLLIEEQRTNSFTYSTTFDSSAWLPNNATLRAGIPELNIYTIIPTATNTTHQFYDQVGKVVTAQAYTISLNGKAYGYTKFKIADVSTGNGCWFDVSAGTVGTANSGYVGTISALGNGFYRCSVTFTPSAGTVYYGIYIGNTTETGTFSANGFSGVYISSPQFEVGSFATSYIPTTTAAATRAADAALMTGNNFTSWFNNSEGTLYVEASPQTQSTNSFGMASFTNLAGSTNSIAVYYTGGTVVDVEALVNSVAQYTFLIARGSQPTKVAHGYKVNDANVALNGTASTADTACLIPQVSVLTIGTIYDATSYPCNGTVRKLAYYPIRVTDAQLAALTS